jgi:hypothetical protein
MFVSFSDLKPPLWGLDSDRPRREASAAEGRDAGGGSPALHGAKRRKRGETRVTVEDWKGLLALKP